ncbi:MAG: hypothetical protein WC516_09725 [Patescibacteria group bacterium]|jgi:hypothetical protein
MVKKKVCKRGKWSAEYNVKLSVTPKKRKKVGSWGRTKPERKELKKIERKYPLSGYAKAKRRHARKVYKKILE